MCDIAATNRTEITLKLPLVYMYDVMMLLERDQNCTEKYDQSCIKNHMCKWAFSAFSHCPIFKNFPPVNNTLSDVLNHKGEGT